MQRCRDVLQHIERISHSIDVCDTWRMQGTANMSSDTFDEQAHSKHVLRQDVCDT